MARTIWGKHTINLDSTVNIDIPAAVVKRPTLTERLNVRRRAKPPPGAHEQRKTSTAAPPAAHGAHGSGGGGSISQLLSGLICGLLFFVFDVVFSTMVFGQNVVLQAAMPMGVGVHALSTLVGSFAFAWLSGCKAVVAGPDVNPTVFVAEAALLISEHICPDAFDSYGQLVGSGSGGSSGSSGDAGGSGGGDASGSA